MRLLLILIACVFLSFSSPVGAKEGPPVAEPARQEKVVRPMNEDEMSEAVIQKWNLPPHLKEYVEYAGGPTFMILLMVVALLLLYVFFGGGLQTLVMSILGLIWRFISALFDALLRLVGIKRWDRDKEY